MKGFSAKRIFWRSGRNWDFKEGGSGKGRKHKVKDEEMQKFFILHWLFLLCVSVPLCRIF